MFFRKMVGLGILSVTALTCFNGVTNVHASDIISSQANEPLELSLDNVYNLEQKTSRISKYVFETKNYTNNKTTSTFEKIQVDFTDAVFYDEEGNIVNKNSVIENIAKDIEDSQNTNQKRSTWREGGSWTSGSGYSICKGTAIHGFSFGFELVFKADYTSVQGGYDQIDRIYGVNFAGFGSWSPISSGIFRKKEQAGYSAYGGVKGALSSNGLTKSMYLYLRVGNDTAWIDSNM
ncbi:hypothetical protein [Enterococcus hirae]|uniref:hypothetical protein n=1 Tax=Enterococcus hirae TaxID=1354 RepID=UPI001F6155A1|nr:hypothetical protein [Enterococcus hirae]MEB7518013.1 hypothetical protein [Enterococcus hirae]